LSFTVRFPNQGKEVEDLDILSHTNATIGSVRRCILNRMNVNVAHTKIELFIGGELVASEDDRKLVEQLNLKDKSVSKYNIQTFSQTCVSFISQVS
jgi:ubiquitin carboxyl-terminal hydrolase 9/24